MRIIRKGISNWKERERKKIVGKKKCPRCKCKFEFEYEDTYKALSIIRVENYYVDVSLFKINIIMFMKHIEQFKTNIHLIK